MARRAAPCETREPRSLSASILDGKLEARNALMALMSRGLKKE